MKGWPALCQRIGEKNGGRWLWKSTPLLENGQLSNGKDAFFYGKNLVIYDPYISYIHLTYHIHCSILRMIGASHFPVLCGHFPSLRMCAYRISVYGPHLQVTPLGGCQEWWATLFTGLVLEMTGHFLEGSDFFAKKSLVLRETNG